MQAHKVVLTACVLTCIAYACAAERQAVKSAAWPAGGAVAGAAVGSLAGPGGTLAGAAIGGGAGHLIGEDASLRSGELQGSGAADVDAVRWRGEAIKQAGALDEFRKWIHEAVLVGIAGFILWFVWRNRLNIGDMGWLKGVWHGIVGGERIAKL